MKIPVTGPTLLRLTAIVVGAIALAVVLPAGWDQFGGSMLIVSGILTAAMLIPHILEASSRRERLMASVRIELNKIRRIYHLSKNLASGNTAHREWFTQLHGFVYEYLMSFEGKDFDAYDGFNASFRKMSYHIYTLPELATKKDEALFNELLRTTSVVAEARQQIKELWDNRMSAYDWAILLLLMLGFTVSTSLAMGDSVGARLAAGMVLAAAFLAVDLLWETDTLNSEKKGIAERYVANVGRLELGRRQS